MGLRLPLVGIIAHLLRLTLALHGAIRVSNVGKVGYQQASDTSYPGCLGIQSKSPLSSAVGCIVSPTYARILRSNCVTGTK